MQAFPKVDVVIPNWNGAAVLEKCLDSLVRQTYCNVNVIVADNGSKDDSLELIRRSFSSVTIIEIGYNSGFATAVNHGIRASNGKYVALLNNDAAAEPTWLERLVEAMEKDPSLGSCACRMLVMNAPSTVNVVGLAFSPHLQHCSKPIGWGQLDTIEFHEPCLVLAPSGGAAMYRRSALEEVGLFDDDYFLYYEDFDLGLRLQLAGYDCLYVPEAVVYHDDEAVARQHPEWILRLNRRNSRWTALKSLPKSVLATMALREPRSHLKAMLSGGPSKGPPEATKEPSVSIWDKRAAVQKLRRISSRRLLDILSHPKRPYPRAEPSTHRHPVALVSHSAELAGSELCLLRLANRLKDSGQSPLVILPGAGPLAAELRKNDIEIARVPASWWSMYPQTTVSSRGKHLLSVPFSSWKAYRLLRDNQVEVVSTCSSVIPHGAIAAWLAGARHAWHVRELYPTGPLRPTIGLGPMLGLVKNLSSVIVVPTSSVGALFDGSDKVFVIPESIGEDFFCAPFHSKQAARDRFGILKDTAVLLLAGTLEPSKGQLDAIRMLECLHAAGTKASLVLCGNEPFPQYREDVLALAGRLGLASYVHLIGFQSDMVSLYDAADVLVVASKSESFGLTIAEAMARKLPVVATRCGGPEAIVVDGETGYLVEIGDEKTMAEKVSALLADSSLAARMGEKGRERALDKYHPERNLADTLARYGIDQSTACCAP